MNKQNNNDTIHKAAKGTSIAVKVMLALGGIALLAFFAWLGVQIYTWLGV